MRIFSPVNGSRYDSSLVLAFSMKFHTRGEEERGGECEVDVLEGSVWKADEEESRTEGGRRQMAEGRGWRGAGGRQERIRSAGEGSYCSFSAIKNGTYLVHPMLKLVNLRHADPFLKSFCHLTNQCAWGVRMIL